MSLSLYFLHFFNISLVLTLACGLLYFKRREEWSDRHVILPFLGILLLAIGSLLQFSEELPSMAESPVIGRNGFLHSLFRLGLGGVLGWAFLFIGGLSLLRLWRQQIKEKLEREREGEEEVRCWRREIQTLKEVVNRVGNENHKLNALSRLSGCIGNSPILESFLRESTDILLEVLGVPTGGICLIDEKEGNLVLKEHRGYAPETLKKIQTVPLGRGLIGRVGLSGTPFLLFREPGNQKWIRTFEKSSPVLCVAAFPLRARKKTLGVFFASSENPECSFKENWNLLESLAHHVGIYIQNHSLLHQVDFQNRRESLFNLINNTIRNSSDPDLVFQVTVHHLGKILGCDRCQYISTVPDARCARITHEYAGPGIQKIIEFGLPVEENNLLSSVLSEGLPHPVVRIDREEGMEGLLPFFKLMGTRSLLLAPILFLGEPYGLLALHHCLSEHNWTQSEIDSVRAVAEQMAIVVKNDQMKKRLQVQEEEARFRREITKAVMQGEKTEDLLEMISKRISSLIPSDSFCIALYDESKRCFRIPFFMRKKKGKASFLTNLLVGGRNTVFSKAFSAKSPLYFQRPPVRSYSEKRGCYLWYMGGKTSLCLPITAGGECAGSLYLSRGLQGDITEDHVRLLKDLVIILSILLQKDLLEKRLSGGIGKAPLTHSSALSRPAPPEGTKERISWSQLISGVIHELKTPLNRMTGHAKFLLEVTRDEKVRSNLEEVLQEAALCQHLLQDLKTLSRRERSERKYININDILLNILNSKKNDFSRMGTRTLTDLFEDLPNTRLAYPVFQRIFHYILHMAQKALRDCGKGGRLTIRTELLPPSPAGEFPSPAPRIRLTFCVEGSERPAEGFWRRAEQDLLFGEEAPSWTLGLFLAKGIIEEHCGALFRVNRMDGTFSIVVYLPLVSLEEISYTAKESEKKSGLLL